MILQWQKRMILISDTENLCFDKYTVTGIFHIKTVMLSGSVSDTLPDYVKGTEVFGRQIQNGKVPEKRRMAWPSIKKTEK